MKQNPIRGPLLLILAALFGACASTEPLGEWIAPDYRGDAAQRVLVIAALQRITRRRAFEDYLVDRIEQTGGAASPGYALLAARLELSRGALEQGINRSGADAVLVVALPPADSGEAYRQPTPAGDGALYAYHERVFAADGGIGRWAPSVIETSLFDARSGRLLWSMQSAPLEPSQPRHVIEAHLAGVIERLRRIGLLGVAAETDGDSG